MDLTSVAVFSVWSHAPLSPAAGPVPGVCADSSVQAHWPPALFLWRLTDNTALAGRLELLPGTVMEKLPTASRELSVMSTREDGVPGEEAMGTLVSVKLRHSFSESFSMHRLKYIRGCGGIGEVRGFCNNVNNKK